MSNFNGGQLQLPLETYMESTRKELLSLQNGRYVFYKKTRNQTASWDVVS